MKRNLTLILALCMTLTMTACGNKAAEATNKTAQTAEYAVLKESVTYNTKGEKLSYETVDVNEQGAPVYHASYSADGMPVLTVEISYHDNGAVSQIKSKSYSLVNGKEVACDEYSFDTDGNMVKHTNFLEGVESYYDVYEYDANRNQLKETRFVNGVEYSCIEYQYEYDANGNTTKKTTYRNGNETARAEYEYDTCGNQLKETRFVNGIESGHIENVYDANGKLLKEAFFQDGVEISRNEYDYNAAGNEVKKTEFTNGKEYARREYEYDKNGYKVKYSFFTNGKLQSNVLYTWYPNTTLISKKNLETYECAYYLEELLLER